MKDYAIPETIKLGHWKHQPPQESEYDATITVDGQSAILAFDTNAPTDRYILESLLGTGAYERQSTEALKRWLKPGNTFIDVGAHIGYFSILASLIVGPEGRVFGFEPNDRNYKRLKLNADRRGNIRTRRYAICEKNGLERFYFNQDNDGGSAFWNPRLHRHNTTDPIAVTVECYRLDSVVTGAVHAIKVDTEGAEMRVLRGAPRLLAHPELKLVICECNPFGLAQLSDNPQQILDLMTANGFKTEHLAKVTDIVDNYIFTRT